MGGVLTAVSNAKTNGVDMISGFKGVIVFTSGRSGTTLLVEQLTNILIDKNPKVPVKNLYELFDTTMVYDNDWNKTWIDRFEIIPRPTSNGSDLWRLDRMLEQVNNSTLFPVAKLFVNDLTTHNYPLVKQYILNDPSYYTISLARRDVANVIYSSILGRALNRWEKRDGKTFEVEPESKYYAESDLYKLLGVKVMQNLDWCLFNKTRMHQTVWYHQLVNDNIDFPELGISREDLSINKKSTNSLQKINTNHKQDIEKHVENYQEVIDFAESIERCCKPVIDRIME
jgi:hypothetical protein